MVYQQRALNWNKAKTRSKNDILAALNVRHQTVKLHLHQGKKSSFQTAMGFLQQSLLLLQFEPESQAEGKLRERAREEAEMLGEYIRDFMTLQ